MAEMHESSTLFGDDMQFVEVELDPNEATIAEAGGMMYMEDGSRWKPSSETGRNSSKADSWVRSWVRGSGC